MGRILFWALLGVVAWLFWRQFTGRAQGLRDDRTRRSADAGQATAAGEPMVSCSVCGLNVPRSEAQTERGRWYCGEEHRRAGAAG